jgi:HAD superfamily hydrolase (TIGR01549 family)
MPTAAIFDLDGTLVCLPINWEALFDELKRIMRLDVVRPLVDVISQADAQTRLEVFAAWDRAELAVVKDITPCAEGMAAYKEQAGKPRALVTMQGKKAVKAILGPFGLHFDVVITREDSISRAEQLLMAAEKLGVSVVQVLFVGNTDSDTAAAEKVGCSFRRVKQP